MVRYDLQILRATKLFNALRVRRYRRALLLGVLAGSEHSAALRHLGCRLVVDVGANRGQFALAAREVLPDGRVIAFEPVPAAASKFREVFRGDEKVALHEMAIGPKRETRTLHISPCDDSSSLLPMTSLQERVFPGTAGCRARVVQVVPLDAVVNSEEISSPALLKLDVQGYELEALKGCESLLDGFSYVYAECSFQELYEGQALAGDVTAWLRERRFHLSGVYNLCYDSAGQAVQGDFLFSAPG